MGFSFPWKGKISSEVLPDFPPESHQISVQYKQLRILPSFLNKTTLKVREVKVLTLTENSHYHQWRIMSELLEKVCFTHIPGKA